MLFINIRNNIMLASGQHHQRDEYSIGTGAMIIKMITAAAPKPKSARKTTAIAIVSMAPSLRPSPF
jgi:hypothetical protein